MIESLRAFFHRKSAAQSRRAAFIATGCSVLLIALLLGMMLYVRGNTRESTYSFENEANVSFSMPLKIAEAQPGTFIVRLTHEFSSVHPSLFYVLPDDCLEALEINGVIVADGSLPLCDFVNGQILNLSSYIRAGENDIVARITNYGGDVQFLMSPSWHDPLLLIPAILIPLIIIGYALFLVRRKNTTIWVSTIFILFALASFIRVFYTFSTPYWVRGHDTDGHIEYIEYVQQHATLPNPQDGWEFWQPPLYYGVGAAWAQTAEWLDIERNGMLIGLQILALMLSIATLGIVLRIGLHLFPLEQDRSTLLPVFFSVIAFFPGLILLSSRINNDVLAVPLAFLTLAFLLEWWRTGSRTMWLATLFTIALHLLTKNNGLLLLPVAYLCLLLKRDLPWKRRMIDGLTGILLVIFVAGWFTAYRTAHNTSQDMIIGNTQTLNSGLLLTNDWKNYVTFNPLQVVKIPYNNPWEDASRRQFFWEYWFRSAFFGEFDFGEKRILLASWILVLAMTMLAMAVRGIFTLKHQRWTYLPLLVAGILLPLGHAAFRYQYPYGSSQDFRYSLVVLLPLGLLIALALRHTRPGIMRSIMLLSVQIFCAFCVAFMVSGW